jgi:acyl-homoserine-lactone acylase
MLRYQQLQLFFFSRGDYWASKILSNQLEDPEEVEDMRGSNTFAFNSAKTEDNVTYLAINTHQPLDGPASWYEAHLVSEEGTNILGALFAGSPNILIGANEHLAWSHTVNYPDKFDVFKLKMDPKKKHTYWVDDKAYPLEVHKAKVYLRILGIPIKVSRKYYKSMYGPTLKNDNGYYAMRTPAFYNIQALQQWWTMNKAQNFTAFYDALKMKAIPGFNIGYADKNDTIFYISNGLIPKRAPGYNWKEVVPGDTKKTLWTETYDIEELPQVIQPKSGYIYNANHSPFYSSSESDNPLAENFSKDMNFETYHNNRSTRLYDLINAFEAIGDQEFKTIKYDRQFPKPFQFNYVDINAIDSISAANYPELTTLINDIQNWDRKADIDSYGAGAFASLYFELQKIYSSLPEDKKVTEDQLIIALRQVKEDLQTHFGAERIQLGDLHRLIRGDKDIPIWGMPDVITAMGSVKLEDGRRKVVSGESYIELVKFTSAGVEIESVISYGSSDHPDSPHYNDQMELYRDFKTKKMTLDKAEVYRNAKKIYRPD